MGCCRRSSSRSMFPWFCVPSRQFRVPSRLQRAANRSSRTSSDKIGGIGGNMQHATTAKMVFTW